jgi:hypothetical protein
MCCDWKRVYFGDVFGRQVILMTCSCQMVTCLKLFYYCAFLGSQLFVMLNKVGVQAPWSKSLSLNIE